MTYNKINIEPAKEEVSQFKLKMFVLLLIAMMTIFINVLVFCPEDIAGKANTDIIPTNTELVTNDN